MAAKKKRKGSGAPVHQTQEAPRRPNRPMMAGRDRQAKPGKEAQAGGPPMMMMGVDRRQTKPLKEGAAAGKKSGATIPKRRTSQKKSARRASSNRTPA